MLFWVFLERGSDGSVGSCTDESVCEQISFVLCLGFLPFFFSFTISVDTHLEILEV